MILLPDAPAVVLRQALDAHRLLHTARPSRKAYRGHRERRHEVNNLLQSLLLNISELRGGPEHYDECVSDIKLAVQALRGVIQEEWRQSEPWWKDGLTREPVSVSDVLAELIDATRARFPGLLIEHEIEPEARAHGFYGGAETLRTLLGHLILNAAEGDGVRAGRTLYLFADRHEDALQLTVSDDGPGLPDDQSQTLYHSTKDQHVGLGLFIVECLVRTHEGSLSLLSGDEDEGVVATVRVPRG